MKMKKPLPKSHEEWLAEIVAAYKDACETISFGLLVGEEIKPEDLFHLAPSICLKFRGIAPSEKLRKKATEAALSSYIATRDRCEETLACPQIAFAFAYLASHFGLGLLEGETVNSVMEFIESKQKVECTPQAGHVGAEIDTYHGADLIPCSNSTGLT